jgi:hypothetical protein
MVKLQRVIEFLHPGAVSLRDYTVESYKGQERITQWNPALGPQPTPEQLAVVAASPHFLAWVASLPKQRKKQQVLASLNARDVESVRLRATLKLIMSVFIETRAAINKLTRELSDAGLNVTQTKLTNRSWEQLEQALAALAEIEVESEVNP